MVKETGKSKTPRVGQQAGDSGKSYRWSPRAVSLLAPEKVSLRSLKTFNRLDEAHPHLGR